MAHKIYIGIDNGVTGTVGWVGENLCPGIEEGRSGDPDRYLCIQRA